MTTATLSNQGLLEQVSASIQKLAATVFPTLRPTFAEDADITNRMLDSRQPGAVVLGHMADEVEMAFPVLAADLRRAALRR